MTESVTEFEIEAAKVMAEIKTVVESLISEGVDLGIIGTCVFYWFLSFYCWNREIDEVKLEKLSSNPKLQTKLAKAMERMVKEVKDEGPTPEMKVLGEKIDRAKALLEEPSPLTETEVEEQITITMQCLHGFYMRARKEYLNGELIENTLFYYWLRVSTMKERVPEAIFQKIERNWQEACRRKDEEMAAFSGVR